MGAITMRLGKVSGPEGALKVKGVKSRLMGRVFGMFVRGGASATKPCILWKTFKLHIHWVTAGIAL
jgi:hypothetical protein